MQNVLKHEFGIRKPWYFLFTKEYWGFDDKIKKEEKEENEEKDDKGEEIDKNVEEREEEKRSEDEKDEEKKKEEEKVQMLNDIIKNEPKDEDIELEQYLHHYLLQCFLLINTLDLYNLPSFAKSKLQFDY